MRSLHFAKMTGAVIVATIISSIGSSASASTFLSYNFNTEAEVVENFDYYVGSGTVEQSASGGLDDSGAISTPGHSSAVFSTKSGFSIGPVGSTYVFTAYMKNEGGDGYSGMGFTALEPIADNLAGYPYRPDDALGISVHGGGFEFSDGDDDVDGYWDSVSYPNPGSITTGTSYSNGGSTNMLGEASPSHWFKVVFTATRDTETTMDTTVEVWPCDASGVVYNASASAVYHFNDRATDLLSAPTIYSYFNFSGDRIHNFDNFSVDLSGGTSVIAEDAPVVLTEDATETAGTIVADGSVTAEGGSSVVERGFVYSTESDPTIDDGIVVLGTGPGDFSGATEVLENDTYFVRAYATNDAGTSYGSEITVEIANGSVPGENESSGGTDSSASALATTGFDVVPAGIIGGLAVFGGVILLARRRNRHNS